MKSAGNRPSSEDLLLNHELSEPSIVIVDALKLRRSCIARVFDQWSSGENLSVITVAPFGLPSECEPKANCRLVVLSIGSKSVTTAEVIQAIESSHSIFPDAPLVVMSDRDEPAEVREAFKAGAMGFIPASLDPQIALLAFTFILGGGSYFPPSALTSTDCGPDQQVDFRDDAGGGRGPGDTSKFGESEQPFRKLTPRQEDVVNLLRNGLPNKVIARHLGMTEATVKVHVRQIMRKVGANNRTQVALRIASLSPTATKPAGPEDSIRRVLAN